MAVVNFASLAVVDAIKIYYSSEARLTEFVNALSPLNSQIIFKGVESIIIKAHYALIGRFLLTNGTVFYLHTTTHILAIALKLKEMLFSSDNI